MKSIFFSSICLLFCGSMLFAQESQVTQLSLHECVQMAVEKNINMVTARIDQEKSGYKISETRAALLPKININGAFQNNLQLPTTVLPGDMIGMPGTNMAIEMGTKYSTSAAISASQILYNQTALTALRLSKKASELNTLGIEKAGEELANEVAKLYFLTLTTFEQKMLLEANITRTLQLRDITKVLVDNGMGKQVDYDRVSVNLENLYTQISNAEAAQEQQMNMIKFMLDIPIGVTIELTDNIEMLLLEKEPLLISDFSNHVDIQMLESNKQINMLNQKMARSGYLPTLALVGQYAYQGLRSSFDDYFQSGPENEWYSSSYIGLNLSIPIFDGLEKRSKVRQAKLDYTKSDLQLENTKDHFQVTYENALNNYKNHKSNVQRQKQNIELAQRVFDETALKYREGLSSMSNLLQDEMGLSSAQGSYLNAIYNLKEAELKIMSLNGEIKNLIKNQ